MIWASVRQGSPLNQKLKFTGIQKHWSIVKVIFDLSHAYNHLKAISRFMGEKNCYRSFCYSWFTIKVGIWEAKINTGQCGCLRSVHYITLFTVRGTYVWWSACKYIQGYQINDCLCRFIASLSVVLCLAKYLKYKNDRPSEPTNRSNVVYKIVTIPERLKQIIL